MLLDIVYQHVVCGHCCGSQSSDADECRSMQSATRDAYDVRARNSTRTLCACQLHAPPPPVGDNRGKVRDLTISLISIPSPGAN